MKSVKNDSSFRSSPLFLAPSSHQLQLLKRLREAVLLDGRTHDVTDLLQGPGAVCHADTGADRLYHLKIVHAVSEPVSIGHRNAEMLTDPEDRAPLVILAVDQLSVDAPVRRIRDLLYDEVVSVLQCLFSGKQLLRM